MGIRRTGGYMDIQGRVDGHQMVLQGHLVDHEELQIPEDRNVEVRCLL